MYWKKLVFCIILFTIPVSLSAQEKSLYVTGNLSKINNFTEDRRRAIYETLRIATEQVCGVEVKSVSIIQHNT